MRVSILRAENQIGGSVLSVSSETTNIILDLGSELELSIPPRVPKIEGLFRGETAYDGILISHHYQDHTGLIPYVLPGIPVYMSRKMEAFYRYAAYNQRVNSGSAPIVFDPNGEKADGSLRFMIGDICVTPLLCCEGITEAYVYLLENNGEKLLYTGGFRYDGRKEIPELFERIPAAKQLLIDATMLSRLFSGVAGPEEQLASVLAESLKQMHPVFFMTSSTNTERFISLFRAAALSGRNIFLDTYQAEILRQAVPALMDPRQHPEVRIFSSGVRAAQESLQENEDRSISMEMIPFKHYVMAVRPGRGMERFLDQLNRIRPLQGSSLVFSMWKGFQEQNDIRRFTEHCRSLGMTIEYIHSSGLEDLGALKRLSDQAAPEHIRIAYASDPEKLKQFLKNY